MAQLCFVYAMALFKLCPAAACSHPAAGGGGCWRSTMETHTAFAKHTAVMLMLAAASIVLHICSTCCCDWVVPHTNIHPRRLAGDKAPSNDQQGIALIKGISCAHHAWVCLDHGPWAAATPIRCVAGRCTFSAARFIACWPYSKLP
jgi:hypothetical protein